MIVLATELKIGMWFITIHNQEMRYTHPIDLSGYGICVPGSERLSEGILCQVISMSLYHIRVWAYSFIGSHKVSITLNENTLVNYVEPCKVCQDTLPIRYRFSYAECKCLIPQLYNQNVKGI